MASRTSSRSRRPAKPARFPDTGHARNYCQVAAEYARKAVDDKKGRSHCKLVRLAAKRFLADMVRAKKPGCSFEFSPAHGNDVCDFIEQLPHVEGKWDTSTITLEAAQVFILVNVFGFRRRDNGTRRFTDVYIEMARKGAKSTLTAGVALYCLTREGEVGPQIVIGATTGDQAKKVFLPAQRMVQRTGELREAYELEALAKSIVCGENGGFIQPINAKSSTQDGWNPHVGILDELHAHKDRGLHDVIKSAFGARKNPLLWRITTAGYNVMGVCYEQRKLVEQILNGVFEADHYFGIVFTLDEGDDPFEEKNWIKANPMIGVTPTWESMRSYAKEAKRSPDTRGEFMTKRLNIWTAARNGWINLEYWKRCGKVIDLAALKALACFGGLDLSATTDITAFVLAWLISVEVTRKGKTETQQRLNLWGRFYLPEDTVIPRTERGNVPYQTWAKQGHLLLTPGNVVDYDYVENDIRAALKEYQVKELAFDPWNAGSTANRLMSEGAPMVEFRQGVKSFAPAMQAFEKLYLSGCVDHDGNPIWDWAAANIVARHDANRNMAPDKSNSEEKIDPIVAALMALGRAVANEGQTPPRSVYEDRGVLLL